MCAHNFRLSLSDTQTVSFHGVPAFGIPGAACFDDELTSLALEGLELVLVQEPGSATPGLLEELRRSRPREHVRVMTLGEHKDVSALQLALEGGREALRAAMEAAVEAACR